MQLNSAQQEAVSHTEGPLLILAGAGAGKTRVIVQRILEIIHKGVAPEQILAITFTNKAAGEMRERIKHHLTDGHVPFVSTFHSLGLTIIKENYRLFGFKRFPAIYDRADSLRTIKEALKSTGAESLSPGAVLGAISRMKGEGIMAEEFEVSAETSRDRTIAAVWRAYDQALTKDQALDFDDLLLRATRFLQSNEEVRTRYQTRWPYMHIDEYQDTNAVQAKLAELLISPQKNICAVGDIDQTIYGWRGAQIANILSFEKKFPGAKIVLLEENYRSTQNILAAANDIIAKNVYRREKNLFTKNPEGALLSLYQAFDELDEALFVVRKVRELIQGEKKQPKDFAVLYRANFQSRALEEAFLGAEIPHQVLGTRFFERKEVKDVISFVRAALYETAPDIARVANVPPRGIGKVTLLAMLSGKPIGGATGVKVASFKRLLAKIKDATESLPPAKLLPFVIAETGIETLLKEDKTEGKERQENLRELVSLASRFEHIEEFLESAALQSDQDTLKESSNAVRLMTVHAAKGLEFPHVFIVGLEEGLFPYEREGEGEHDREEERRLMYVALTRAEQKIYVSYAAYRTVFGSKNATLPSQFLSDLPQHLIELEAPERLGRTIYLD
ncbi:UvrD-helicase domain-containing protein [Candidatus Parcubacteria bacterium]|nr:UvrD-helicase domain-containing protein [Candidatus Parcubacteria bacterium]